MLGDEDGRVPDHVRPLISGEPEKHIVCSDDFSAAKLGLHWQWNHNPVNSAWSLTERPGFLRLKTSRVVPNLYLAPNTLTQRMEGPTCSGYIKMDVSKMKDGDCAGLAAFNGDSGVLTIMKVGKKLVLEMSEQKVSLTDREKAVTKVEVKTVETVDLNWAKNEKRGTRNVVFLKVTGDFQPGHGDAANFYYSLDGKEWAQIGTKNYRCVFDYRRFFMGSKFGIFNYATKSVGGYVDVDEFCYEVAEK
jgi:beta-xylosidase